MTDKDLSTIEARLLATQSKCFGPGENVAAIASLADEAIPLLCAEIRRLRDLPIDWGAMLKVAE